MGGLTTSMTTCSSTTTATLGTINQRRCPSYSAYASLYRDVTSTHKHSVTDCCCKLVIDLWEPVCVQVFRSIHAPPSLPQNGSSGLQTACRVLCCFCTTAVCSVASIVSILLLSWRQGTHHPSSRHLPRLQSPLILNTLSHSFMDEITFSSGLFILLLSLFYDIMVFFRHCTRTFACLLKHITFISINCYY